MAAKSENLNSNSILRSHEQNLMLKFIEIKFNEFKLPQKQICNHIGFFDSTIKQYRDDIQMESPYNRKKYWKKNNKSNSTITQTRKQTTNEITKNI